MIFPAQNVHQDQAGWSDAVTHTAIARDIAMVKECGMNFIRGSHYPHHPYFAEECVTDREYSSGRRTVSGEPEAERRGVLDGKRLSCE